MGRKKKDTNIINIEELEIENKVEIDYDKLAQAIVKAKQIEKENELREREEAITQWHKEIGYKEYTDKSGRNKNLFSFFNRVKVFCNVMFLSKKKIIATSPIDAFLQLMTSKFFGFIKCVLTAVAIIFAVALFYHPGVEYGFLEYFAGIVFTIASFILSRVFRLMAIEIDQMSNREQVLGIFTAIISVFPLIEKVIDLFQEAV